MQTWPRRRVTHAGGQCCTASGGSYHIEDGAAPNLKMAGMESRSRSHLYVAVSDAQAVAELNGAHQLLHVPGRVGLWNAVKLRRREVVVRDTQQQECAFSGSAQHNPALYFDPARLAASAVSAKRSPAGCIDVFSQQVQQKAWFVSPRSVKEEQSEKRAHPLLAAVIDELAEVAARGVFHDDGQVVHRGEHLRRRVKYSIEPPAHHAGGLLRPAISTSRINRVSRCRGQIEPPLVWPRCGARWALARHAAHRRGGSCAAWCTAEQEASPPAAARCLGAARPCGG